MHNPFEHTTPADVSTADTIRKAALTSVNIALTEKHMPPAYVIGFKGSYAMNLQSKDSDIDVIVYVKPDVTQELLLGNRPLSKEFTLAPTDNHPKIEVNVQSVTHLTRSLHKMPFNTVEVFAGVMEPEYHTTTGCSQGDSEGEQLTKHIRAILSTTDALNAFQKTLFFMGYNIFNKTFCKLDKQWRMSNDPSRNEMNDARHKAFAKSWLFYSILTHNNESVFDVMRVSDEHIRLYHDCRNGWISDHLRETLDTFYNDDDTKKRFIDYPTSVSNEHIKATDYILTLVSEI